MEGAGLAVTDVLAFRFRALRPDGSAATGVLGADDPDSARRALSAQGLIPVEVTVSAGYARRRLPASELALGLRILSDVLGAGLPVDRALAVFADLAPESWRTATPAIREDIRTGHSLASALSRAPVRVPPVVIGMLRAGEGGSGLSTAVRRAADHAARTAATQQAARSALAYPLIVAAAGIASLGVLVGVVIPKFSAILTDLGQTLPPMTRLVLSSAEVLRVAALPVAVAASAVAVAIVNLNRTEAGRVRWCALLLRVPILGQVRRAGATARFATSLAALLAAGVPLQRSLQFAAESTGDAEVERRVHAAIPAIAAGAPLSTALAQSGVVPSASARLIAAGEQSGRLISLLEHAAELEQARADRLVTVSVRALEPGLIISFALVVGLVAAALLQAVYAVRPA